MAECVPVIAITVSVGDTSSAALLGIVQGATLTWSEGDTAVARIAGVSAGGLRVIVRGVETGTTAVTFRIVLNGESVTGSIPVQVVARSSTTS